MNPTHLDGVKCGTSAWINSKQYQLLTCVVRYKRNGKIFKAYVNTVGDNKGHDGQVAVLTVLNLIRDIERDIGEGFKFPGLCIVSVNAACQFKSRFVLASYFNIAKILNIENFHVLWGVSGHGKSKVDNCGAATKGKLRRLNKIGVYFHFADTIAKEVCKQRASVPTLFYVLSNQDYLNMFELYRSQPENTPLKNLPGLSDYQMYYFNHTNSKTSDTKDNNNNELVDLSIKYSKLMVDSIEKYDQGVFKISSDYLDIGRYVDIDVKSGLVEYRAGFTKFT